jgi:hypothetical protein
MQSRDTLQTQTNSQEDDTELPNTLRLHDVASWQLPSLAPRDANGQPVKPRVLAGLPSLQRGAVWKPNQIELLWDSILRGFPIGSLVACRCLPPTIQSTRPGAVAGSVKPWPEDQYDHHLLDGQQRANALALGYLDPFITENDKEELNPDTLLWLDLDPSNNKFPPASTRHHLLRVTTKAHPWGFNVSDDKEPQRLSSGQAFEAIQSFRCVHPVPVEKDGSTNSDTCDASNQRPRPFEGWPVVANAPLPLSWALLAAEKLWSGNTGSVIGDQDAKELWVAVLNRVQKLMTQGRAVGASNGVRSTDTPSDDSNQKEEHKPWWVRANDVLYAWTADTATLTQRAQSLRLAQALRRAVRTQLIVLNVPQDALDAPSRLESLAPASQSDDSKNENVANLEHLFARLNNGGTMLSADDLTYSMIKAYWPGIEHTIGKIEKRPPETQVALLGARLARAEAVWKKGSGLDPNLPAAPDVSAIRQLGASREQATVQDGDQKQVERQAWRGRMNEFFGLQPVDAINPTPIDSTPIAQALARVNEWFGYDRNHQSWGLPNVLLARMATEASEVYLFLLWLAHQNGTEIMPVEDIRKSILGLATALHWFGKDRERAVREMWKTKPEDWLHGTAFRSKAWLNALHGLTNENEQPTPAVSFIPSPKELENYIDQQTLQKDASIKEWKWWDSLVVSAVTNEWHAANPGKKPDDSTLAAGRDARWAKWSGVVSVLSSHDYYRGRNGLLLMYAQRDQMDHYFRFYDPRDAGFWDKHNVPWDFDHLLQQNAFKGKRANNTFQKVCQQWGNTIANLHLLPFELNRARSDDPLEKALDWDPLGGALKRALLLDQNDNSRLLAFSMDNEELRDNKPDALSRVHTFTIESRARLLRIYSDWFNTLSLGQLKE